MSSETTVDIEAAFRDDSLIVEALNEAIRQAILAHQRAGLPLAIWEDGQTVWITAEEALRRLEAAAELPAESFEDLEHP
jgi:hypothetical protein